MLRKIRTVNGDSFYVVIPKYLIDIFNLKQGQYVNIISKGKKIIIETEVAEDILPKEEK